MLEAVSEKWEELVSLQNQASFSLFLQIYSSVFDGLKLFSRCPPSYAFENILVFHAFSCDIFTYSCLCYMYRQWLPGHLQFLHQKPLGVTNAREFLSSSFLLSLLLENLCNEGFFFSFCLVHLLSRGMTELIKLVKSTLWTFFHWSIGALLQGALLTGLLSGLQKQVKKSLWCDNWLLRSRWDLLTL